MEEKILKTIVIMSIENITRELRKYSKEPLQCDITIFSRDQVVKDETDPEGTPEKISSLRKILLIFRDFVSILHHPIQSLVMLII